MELRHIRYFVAVAEELSFRRAATRLMIAQPPLSQQIRDLELELGVQLFDRRHRQVRLTTAGQVFLRDAQQILAKADLAVRRVQRAERGEFGRLTIGYTSLIYYPYFPDVLRSYHADFPDVELVLRDLVAIEQMQQLHTNTLDISFAAHIAATLTPQQREYLGLEVILHEPLVAALPPTHHLAAQNGSISLAALADEPWIWFARTHDPVTYDYMMRLFEQAGFRPHVAQEVTQQQVFLGLVAAGLGVSLIPASIRRMVGSELVCRDIAEPTPMVEFNVVWRQDDSSPLIQTFLQVVRDIANATQHHPPKHDS
jgi:DNA-binding transcriptional LysR family regulator